MTKKAQDVLNDNSHAVLYKIAEAMNFKLPKYVESGIPLEKEAADHTDSILFADERNRRFPLTDRANTWLSGAYFAKTASSSNYSRQEYGAIAKKIIKAAELYGISADVQNVMHKITQDKLAEAKIQAEKEAAEAKRCYGEPETNGFPMFSKEQTKKACDYFGNNAYAYDWRRRSNIAKNIMRKAAEYGITVPSVVRKEAGAGFPRVDYLAENLLTREAELERRGLHKMAGDMRRTIKIICEANPEELLSQLEPLREMISSADELSGIDEDYGRRFNPPADFLFDVDDNDAVDFREDTVPLCGELMSARALSGLPRRIFESVLSPAMVNGMMENGRLSPKKVSITVIRMAPRDQKSLLNSIQDFTSNAGEDYTGDEEDGDKEQEDNEKPEGKSAKEDTKEASAYDKTVRDTVEGAMKENGIKNMQFSNKGHRDIILASARKRGTFPQLYQFFKANGFV